MSAHHAVDVMVQSPQVRGLTTPHAPMNGG